MPRRTPTILLLCLALVASALAFVPTALSPAVSTSQHVAPLKAAPIDLFAPAADSSSSLVAVATLDPTTILSNTLGGLLGSSAILAVPILAALGVAALVAFLIVSYANPADED
ncbi:hypothetical protein ACHAXT_012232 [Thalassiosira profunda]